MKYDIQNAIAALKAKALPIAEKDLISAIDCIMENLGEQCAAQPGDATAMVVGLIENSMKPAIDAEMAKLLPDAAKA